MTGIPPLLQGSGITYRQVVHWIDKGYLMKDQRDPGPGNARVWPIAEQQVALRMYRMVAAGITPAVAEVVARLVDNPGDIVDLDEFVAIQVLV